jgi:hypothetical protein
MTFPGASIVRSSVNFDLVVFDEITEIERAIIVAADSNLLEATVNDDTTMTNSTPADSTSQAYFNVWQKTVTNREKLFQMTSIISHFENLGYIIARETNSNDSTVFQWKVTW